MQTSAFIADRASPTLEHFVQGLRERRRRSAEDRALARSVYTVMESDEAPSVDGLHFYIFEGAVSVYGAVGTIGERDAVVAALSRVRGIGQIADHLTVLS